MEIRERRNPHRVLQYIGHIRKAVSLGQLMGLLPNGDEAKRLALLKEHYEGRLETDELVRIIKRETGIKDTRALLLGTLTRARTELHPVNNCNYRCPYCSWYGNLDGEGSFNKSLPLASLGNLKFFDPSGIVISGGFCEPTMFSDGENTITNLIQTIAHLFPQIKIGMNSNGSRDMGDGVALLDWLRINIDAGTEETYRQKKGKSNASLQQVLGLARDYIDREIDGHQIISLGFGFLYMGDNVEEVIEAVRIVYETFKDSNNYRALNLQFRPLRPLMTDRVKVDHDGTFDSACTPEQLEKLNREIARLKESASEGLCEFIEGHTNLLEIFQRYKKGNVGFGYEEFPPLCIFPVAGIVIGAMGNCYSCLEGAEVGKFDQSQKLHVGNFLQISSEEERLRIALNTFYAMNRVKEYCNHISCSQGEVIIPAYQELGTKRTFSFTSPFF